MIGRHSVTRGEAVGAYLTQIAFIVPGRPLAVGDHDCIRRIEDGVSGLMANREALPINILVIVHQDAMAGDRVIDIQTGDIRVRESTSKNVKTYPTEIVIYVTRDRIGCISKL
jgi:hypothetical protein